MGNGSEFPGATGGLSVETENEKPVLVLNVDFTKGGNKDVACGEITILMPVAGVK